MASSEADSGRQDILKKANLFIRGSLAMDRYSVMGQRIPRLDSQAKVSGEAKYTGDIALPRMLCGKILRSPHAYARIKSIDTSRAEKLPGVRAVLTGQELGKVRFGFFQVEDPRLMDRYPLAVDVVRYIGDEVAAVAAIDEDTAQEALELIQVDYEPLPAVLDLEAAIQEGAPQLHELAPQNIAHRLPLSCGDVEAGLRSADIVREDVFRLSPLIHGNLEPRICLAHFDVSGKLTLWSSHQMIFDLRRTLARLMGLPEGKVRAIKPAVGGANCGKLEPLAHHFCAAMLSQRTRRPVKIELSREEVFAVNRGAQPTTVRLRTGATRDGKLLAHDAALLADSGAYLGIGFAFNLLSGFSLTIPYAIPNFRYEGTLVYTNNPPCSSQRGCGYVTMRYAAEVQLDRIAQDLGIDPAEMRAKNALKDGDRTFFQYRLNTCGLRECIDRAVEESGWKEKKGKLPRGRGIGMACGCLGPGGKSFPGGALQKDFSFAWVKIEDDGTVKIYTGASDVGQGSDTLLAQVVAEELGIGLEAVVVIAADSEVTPYDFGSYGSRVTISAGNAAKVAAAKAKARLLEAAAQVLDADPEHLEVRQGKIFVPGRPDRSLSFADAVKASAGGKEILAEGQWDFYQVDPQTEVPNVAYSFGAQIAEVEVDPDTGKVSLLRITTAWDCGYPINPMGVEGQIEGQIGHGIGQALTEERLLDRGQNLNPSFLDYKMPTALETPPTETILVETVDPKGPFGAKECAEGPQIMTHPAIANAIHDAVGLWPEELPMTPDKILDGMGRK